MCVCVCVCVVSWPGAQKLSISLANDGYYSKLITNSNLEYDNKEKEEVGIATKLVEQEKREECDHIVLCCADLVGAKLPPIRLGVVDEDGPIFYRLFSARFPVYDNFLQSFPPSQHSSPWAAS